MCEEHPNAKSFGERELGFGSALPKEFHREGGQQPGAVAARPIGVHSAAVRQPFQRLQCVLQNFLCRRATETRDKSSPAGVMIRVSPIGMAEAGLASGATTHISLIVVMLTNVQCTIFMECISFPKAQTARQGLEFGGFAEVKIADFHGRNDHFEGFLARGSPGLAQQFNVL
jgi:hypothetical protein